MISFDDGHPLDLKTADLLEKYGLTAIFFIPSCSPLKDEEIQRLAHKHEIGGHTVNHPMDLKLVHGDELRFEIEGNKEDMEATIGKKITKFCYPRGRYNEKTIQAVKRAGYTTARTTVVGHTVLPDDPYQQHTTVHFAPRKEYEGKDWLDYALEHRHSPYFHGWGHSLEIDRNGDWQKLETLFREMQRSLTK